MSQAVQSLPADAAEPPAKSGKLGLVLGLVGALVAGGGSFYAIYSGLLDPTALLGGGGGHAAPEGGGHGGGHGGEGGDGAVTYFGDIAFVKMDSIMVSLPPSASAKLLRFTGQLEVAPEHAGEVVALMPRVVDALNTYLRAVDIADLEAPDQAVKIRAQMLRRVQIVTGEGRVGDLLVTEFVLN